MPAPSRLPLRTIVASTVLALAAALAVVVVLGGPGDDPTPVSPEEAARLELDPEGTTDPADAAQATFTTFDDEERTLADLRGRPTVINFFASTCVPCVTEMPAFQQVFEELGDQVAFLGLAVADRPEEAQALVARTGVTYPTAQDRDGDVINALEGTMLPTTVLLAADGTVAASHTGALTADELRDLLVGTFGLSTPTSAPTP